MARVTASFVGGPADGDVRECDVAATICLVQPPEPRVFSGRFDPDEPAWPGPSTYHVYQLAGGEDAKHLTYRFQRTEVK